MLVAANTPSADAPAYWSAVVTTIPVLALAVVLESRRTAIKMSRGGWRIRGMWTVIFVVYAGALLWAFYLALDGLRFGRGLDDAATTNSLLGAVLLLLVGTPLLDLAIRLNPEAFRAFDRSLPWSPHWKSRRQLASVRRSIRRTLRGIKRDVTKAEKTLEFAQSALADARQSVKLYWIYREISDGLGGSMQDGTRAAQLGAEVEKASIESGAAFLAPGSSVGVIEFRLQRALGSVEFLRDHADEGKRLMRRVDVRLRALGTFRTTPKDRAQFDEDLEKARREWASGV